MKTHYDFIDHHFSKAISTKNKKIFNYLEPKISVDYIEMYLRLCCGYIFAHGAAVLTHQYQFNDLVLSEGIKILDKLDYERLSVDEILDRRLIYTSLNQSKRRNNYAANN